MVHMSGMPVAPQRDATFSKGALEGGSFGPAAGAAFRPPAPAEETAALPAEVVLPAKAEPELLPRSALMGSQLAETWPPPKRSQFAETWPPPKRSHLSLDPLPTRMYGAAKSWVERSSRKLAAASPSRQPSPSFSIRQRSGTTEEPTGSPRLHAAVKPFGKDGVRLGWQCKDGAIAEGERLFLESCPMGSGAWVEHQEVQPGGKVSGVTVIKASAMPLVDGQSGVAPAKRAWRLRSSLGDVSEPTRLGEKRSVARGGASGVWRKGGGAEITAAKSAGPASSEGGGGSGGAVRQAVAALEGLGVEALQALVLARRGEVDCLLRIEMANAADVDKARDRVQEALAFDDELCELAASRGVIKGKLFQALLEELRATGASHAQLDNSCKKFGGFGVAKEFKLNLAEWASLTMKADALRNLVRIKVADDVCVPVSIQGPSAGSPRVAMVALSADYSVII